MKNFLLSLAALTTIGGTAFADDSVLNTKATVKLDAPTAVVVNKAYVGGNYNRDTEKTDVAVVWSVDAVRARVLGLPVTTVAGANFGRTPREFGVTAGFVTPVASVMGTQVNLGVTWVVPTDGWVVEPKPRVGVFFKR